MAFKMFRFVGEPCLEDAKHQKMLDRIGMLENVRKLWEMLEVQEYARNVRHVRNTGQF